MSLWQYTEELESLFIKYGLPVPQKGSRDWIDLLMTLIRTMDNLVDTDLRKLTQEQGQRIRHLEYELITARNLKQPWGGIGT